MYNRELVTKDRIVTTDAGTDFIVLLFRVTHIVKLRLSDE